MNTSGEVADLMVKEGIQITESAVKLTALGAKNLAAIVMALVRMTERPRVLQSSSKCLKQASSFVLCRLKNPI